MFIIISFVEDLVCLLKQDLIQIFCNYSKNKLANLVYRCLAEIVNLLLCDELLTLKDF